MIAAKTIRSLLVATGVILAIVIAAWYWSRPNPIAVIVKPVERGIVESTVSNTRAGTVTACRRARIAPATGGQIARIFVHEGDSVRDGQILVELWNEDLTAQVKLAGSDAIAARENANAACLRAEEAQREANRASKLRTQGLIAEDAADRALTNAKTGETSCKAAKANMEVSAARIAVAKAALERTIIKAPFDGIIAQLNGEVGEFVTPSPTGIATLPVVDLIDNHCLYITAPIDEVDATRIRAGMDARISLDAFSNKQFHGTVKRVAPYVQEIEKQARTVDVEALFTADEDFKNLLAGYSADIEVILDARKDTLRVPTEAVAEGHRVLVFVPETGKVEERTIQTGLSNWKYTEVISGLTQGERVVTTLDRQGVKAGAYVQLEE